MDIFLQIQLTCLRDAIASKHSEKAYDRRKKPFKPESGFLLRQIFRWYSKTFHTPLADVDALPLHEVLEAWWEERYSDMSEEDLEAERQELLQDPADVAAQQLVEDAQDADAQEMINEELAAKAQEVVKSIEKLTTSLTKPMGVRTQKESELVMGPAAPKLPEIQFTFNEDLDLEGDGLGLLDRPKKAQS